MNIFLTMAALLVTGTQASPSSLPEPDGWGGRQVFAFGDIALDFGKGVERFSIRPTGLEDCSTATLFCAAGVYAKVVLPRRCPAAMPVGTSWSAAGLRSEIVWAGRGQVPGEEPGPSDDILLIGTQADPGAPTRARREIVWAYERSRGVYGIYAGPPTLDVIDLARRSGILGLRADSRVRLHLLSTFDGFGHCRKTA